MNKPGQGIYGPYIALTIQSGDRFIVDALVHHSRIRSIKKMLTLNQASVVYGLPCEMKDAMGVSMCSFGDVYGWLTDYAVNGEGE